MSVKVQVIFYSMYGHIHKLAEAVATGAREVEGAEVQLFQVPELVPAEVLEKSGAAAARNAATRRSSRAARPAHAPAPVPAAGRS